MEEKTKGLKTLLIERGIVQIEEHGYQNISLRKLAADCQVSHVAVYRHFKNKEALFTAMIPQVSENFASYLKNGKKNHATARQRLIHLAYRFISYSQDRPHLFDFLFNSPYALAAVVDEKGQLQLEMDVSSFDYNKEVIQDFIQSLEGDYDFNLAFMHLWSFVFGIAMLIRQGIYSTQTVSLTQVIESTLAFYQ